jgi:hypothetical protein
LWSDLLESLQYCGRVKSAAGKGIFGEMTDTNRDSWDSTILQKLQTIDSQARKIRELIQQIADSQHPHSELILAALKENGFEIHSSAEHCFIPATDKWTTDNKGNYIYIGKRYGRE